MKISSIKTFILRVPLGDKQFYSSQAAFPERNSLLVRVETDDGCIGWGEGGQYGPAEPVAAVINHVMAPMLLSRNPLHHGRIWEELYAQTRDFGQKGAYIEAISALDIALWDISGQVLGHPVAELLGGAFRDRVPAYATGCYYGSDFRDSRAYLPALAEEAHGYVQAGFDTLKMKIGLLNVEADLERVSVVREAIGPDIRLLVDGNHAYNAFTAIRIGSGLQDLDVRWFEEPVVPEDHDGYRRVRQALRIPIAGGECEYTRFGFRNFIAGQCVDIIQPDLCVAGGISEWVKIHALATSYGVASVPHVWGSGVALAAALQVLATIPPFPHTANPIPLQNEPMVEYDRKHNPLRDDLLIDNFSLVDGSVLVPQGPGLGICVNEEVLRQYAQPILAAAAD
ncbi:MAG: mandelate racemase/muconate lactonizing enzyme family protein [Chloroflexi bacterium]|nr:mandelate racemase/muconate lactonizing enzyme family protein [Chloroflexota bacterium]